MRVTVARLRRGIMALACLLLVVLAGFFIYARYRLHRLAKDLPAKLGIDIQQTANGFTYSQSSKGHTYFTIHASKLIQYKTGGHASLHDVHITLYGPEGSNRTDRIYGSDFDYDPQAGIASAKGEVQIDLAGLAPNPAAAAQSESTRPTPAPAADSQNAIHVKTSGLVFNTKTGDAVTSEHMEFVTPRASGESTGARYNSKTGLLVLDHQVEITTTANGNQAVVHAAHAELLRDSRQASLLHPDFDYQSQKSSADQAIVYFRKDGSVEHIDAEGHIHVTGQNGAVLTAGTSHVQLDAKSQPVQVDMGGGINFVSNDENHSLHGNAVEGTLNFGSMSTLKHAQLRNAVSFVDQVLKLNNDPKGTASRELQASTLDIDFAPGPDPKKSIAQKALATGNATINLHTIPSKGPQQLTTITGDQLLATLENGKSLKQLDGSGNTRLVDLAADGSVSTSKGDRLLITFAPRPPQPTSKPAQSASHKTAARAEPAPSSTKPGSANGTQNIAVDTAIQDGNVVLTQTPAKKPDATTNPATLTAWASRSEYHASTQTLHLTGDPRLNDGQSLQLSADVLDYHRDSGDAAAEGAVKATYTQPKNQKGTQAAANSGPTLGETGPVHITADRARLHHETNTSIFYGSADKPARMWQGDNSVLAPVLELTRTPQTLKAYGEGTDPTPVVNANLTSAIGAKHQHGVVRVHSQSLVYSDADRRGDFHGSVTAEDPDGVIRAEEVQVYLTPTPQSPAGSATPSPTQSQLDRIVAIGHVVLTQPGRKGVGEKLVYTADDGKYILTGAPGNPPRISDQAKGTTTGSTLIFNSQDDSVVVSGGQSSAVTDTRAPR
ncbi:MAG TPA: LptA/OstA family protein [Silvibacterium sp.]|nr:LptA/OstA family protein [Silvibacterium sp.]